LFFVNSSSLSGSTSVVKSALCKPGAWLGVPGLRQMWSRTVQSLPQFVERRRPPRDLRQTAPVGIIISDIIPMLYQQFIAYETQMSHYVQQKA
jgi:hypothetical protein